MNLYVTALLKTLRTVESHNCIYVESVYLDLTVMTRMRSGFCPARLLG
jgi:hypothetical protein